MSYRNPQSSNESSVPPAGGTNRMRHREAHEGQEEVRELGRLEIRGRTSDVSRQMALRNGLRTPMSAPRWSAKRMHGSRLTPNSASSLSSMPTFFHSSILSPSREGGMNTASGWPSDAESGALRGGAYRIDFWPMLGYNSASA